MLCTSAARSELSIVKTLFARARTPLDLPALRVATLPTAVLSFLFIFGVLFAAIGDIKYFTATYLAWSLLDCIVFPLERRHLLRVLDDAVYNPAESDEHHDFIIRRRDAVTKYLRRFHEVRLGAVVCGALVATGLAWSVGHLPEGLSGISAHALILLTIAANEIVMAAWRHSRNLALYRVDGDQIRCDRERAAQRRGLVTEAVASHGVAAGA